MSGRASSDGPPLSASVDGEVEVKRAGEQCYVPLGQEPAVVFTVPPGRSMRNCATAGPLLRDPRFGAQDSLGGVMFTPTPFVSVLGLLDNWRSTVETARWDPVAGRAGYRIDYSPGPDQIGRLHVIDVGPGSLFVSGRSLGESAMVDESIEALVESIRIVGAENPPEPLDQPGGWCGGYRFVVRVPANLFAAPDCSWLSSINQMAPGFVRGDSGALNSCGCDAPIRVESVTSPLGADFGLSEIFMDSRSERSDGVVVRTISGTLTETPDLALSRQQSRSEPGSILSAVPPPRPSERAAAKVKVLDFGDHRVVVIADPLATSALPGSSWPSTLRAQNTLVASIRSHSDPECAQAPKRLTIRPPESAPATVGIDMGGTVYDLPAGTAVLATGCERSNSEIEVRVAADPAVIGWIGEQYLADRSTTACPSGEGTFRPTNWEWSTPGDFDGDGRIDMAYSGQRDRPTDQTEEPIAVLFANGGLATGSSRFDSPVTVERFVGADRHLIVQSAPTEGGWSSEMYRVTRCQFEAVASWNERVTQEVRSGSCRYRQGLVDFRRSWSEQFDEHQGWVSDSDETISFAGTQVVPAASGNDDPSCGPKLAQFVPIIEGLGPGAGTDLAGEHRLSLQWLRATTIVPGTLMLAPLGADRYEVTGQHVGTDGELRVVGQLEQVGPDELWFEGVIESTVKGLDRAQPCVRRTAQRFMRRPGTETFRMQDRVSCDGYHTDWIDITISSGRPGGN